MIINHRYRFIFLKTKKTAGTSVEIALSQYCGPDDIVTRLGSKDEPKRTELGYQGPVNYLVPRSEWTDRDRAKHLRHAAHRLKRSLMGKEINLRKEVSYYNHMPAEEVLARIGPETWNGYFKFCFERNPWDRAISAYFWENRNRKRMPDFYGFLQRMQHEGKLSNFETYAIDGKIAVDEVLLFEQLPAELDRLPGLLGLPGPLALPRTKQQFRRDRRPYQEFYSPRERDYVAEVCSREIAAFGYQFDASPAGEAGPPR
jgi:hypothetical protein